MVVASCPTITHFSQFESDGPTHFLRHQVCLFLLIKFHEKSPIAIDCKGRKVRITFIVVLTLLGLASCTDSRKENPPHERLPGQTSTSATESRFCEDPVKTSCESVPD